MAAYKSSSLVASDIDVKRGSKRHSSGLMGNTSERISKQSLTSHKMFGNRRGQHGKDFKIGKKFKKHGKGIVKSIGDIDAGSISPSVEEFDDFMQKASGGSDSKKKSLFQRKQFG